MTIRPTVRRPTIQPRLSSRGKVAEAPDGRIVGYVMGKAEGDDELWHGHVTAVTVSPEYRRMGLATELMRYLENVSEHEHDCYFVDLCVDARPSSPPPRLRVSRRPPPPPCSRASSVPPLLSRRGRRRIDIASHRVASRRSRRSRPRPRAVAYGCTAPPGGGGRAALRESRRDTHDDASRRAMRPPPLGSCACRTSRRS
jgi:hypothetical protein